MTDPLFALAWLLWFIAVAVLLLEVVRARRAVDPRRQARRRNGR